MATNIWRGGTPAVAQVATATPANVEVGDIFTLTLTDDNGDTAEVGYTAQLATVADVTAGLVAAWNASTDPRVARITAADQTTHLTLTADEPGRPFDVAGAATDGGGTDDQTLTVTEDTANAGPYDWNTASNWSLGRVPAGADDVVVHNSATSILYGLAQSAASITDVRVMEAFAASIGRIDSGVLYPLQISPTGVVEIEGKSPLVAIDFGTTTCSTRVRSFAPTTGSTSINVWLTGTALGELNVERGNVGIGAYPGQGATLTTDLNVVSGHVRIGENVSASSRMLQVLGGTVETWTAFDTVKVYAGGTLRQWQGAWATLDAWGTVYANAAATYATTTIHHSGKLYTETLVAKTLTSVTMHHGAQLADPAATMTFTNPISKPGGGEVSLVHGGTSVTPA